jgi:hypothetical protein
VLLFYAQFFCFQDVTQGSPFDNVGVAWGVLELIDGSPKWLTISGEDDDDDENSENNNNNNNNSQDDDDEAHHHSSTMLLPHGQLPEDFWVKISRNTEYVLHVEEITAENFVLCCTQESCASASHVRAMCEVLSSATEEDKLARL